MRTRPLPTLIAATAAAAVLGLGGVAVAARSDGGARYRTAVASTEAVDQVLDAVGTIEPVSQAAVAFPTSGTAASVAVEVGDEVAVGEILAGLDTDELEVSLHEAQAGLAQAELVLQLALDGEEVASAGAGTPGGGLGRSAGAAASGALADAQQAVLDAQHAVDESLAAAEAAMAAAADVCSVDEAPTTTTTTPEATDDAVVDDGTTTCREALAAALDAQRALADAQAELAAASSALTDLLAELADDAVSTPTTTTTTPSTPAAPSTTGPSGVGDSASGEGAGSTASPSTDAAPGAGSSSAASSPSAEDLIAHQKAVDAASLQVAVAEQALAQAEIVSPIAGTVASVGISVGDQVEAASATQTVVVVGSGGFEVTTKVSVADLPDLEVGQAATVRPDGSEEAIDGEVVRIGVAPDAASGTSTYAVTIGLTGDTSTLGNGSTASVEIVTRATADALAVPTSAVAVDGDRSTVRVLGDDGDPEEVTVEVGAVGATWTEIVDGVEEGDVVVLADLDEPLPGSATDGSSSSAGGQGGSGVPGGGAFPGGAAGGPPSGAGGRPGG
ncbi:MAG: HlyD family efflux transporter periplasmic adaptor subunit [Acidimicrobiales bacterium]